MRRFLVAALLGASAGPGLAQHLDDRVSIQAGAYFARVNSEGRVGLPDGGPGTSLDLEKDLGLDRSAVLPAVEIGWRINDDWVLNGEFYALGRRSERRLEREIMVGETTYPVNARLAAGFDSDIYRLTVTNLLFQRPKFELGAALGVHMTDFALFVEGEGSVGAEIGAVRRESRTLFAPLPTIGGVFRWEPGPRWLVSANVDWLSLSLGDYSGRLINAEGAVAYRLWRRVDAGVQLRRVDYRVDVSRQRWDGRVRYRLTGPAVFVQVGF